MKKIIFILFWSLMSLSLLAQTPKYWIVFDQKPQSFYNTSPQSYLSAPCIQNRMLMGLPLVQETDFPLNDVYTNQLEQELGVRVLVKSRWLNAVSAELSNEQKAKLRSYAFVKEVRTIHSLKPTKINAPNKVKYYAALKYINAQALADAKLNGKGLKIGVIDVGFENADSSLKIQYLFNENRIKAKKDYVNPKTPEDGFFHLNETSSDYHGAEVLGYIAGHHNDLVNGLAQESEFYLARTDHGDTETRQEEDNWIAALEWMEQQGVRLINTSLGYADHFDDDSEDYTPNQMDGKTTLVSKAANIASEQKGMCIVVAAGNEGRGEWRVVSAPADAQGVLSVGATDLQNRRAEYSSFGASYVKFIKPNLSVYSSDGTSFAAPIVTGLAACILQLRPDLKPRELFALLEKSCHMYPYGNNYLGYGVPQCDKLLKLANGDSNVAQPQVIEANGKTSVVVEFSQKIPRGQTIVVYHKDSKVSPYHVMKESLLYGVDKAKVTIPRDAEATSTTVTTGFACIEINW